MRLRVEGDLFVGYGFGDQRVTVPRSSVKAVGHYSRRRYRGGPSEGLVLLDGADRILLRAKGDWRGEPLVTFCRRAGLPRPQSRDGGRLWRRAPGYRRLRTAPRGAGLAAALIVVFVLAVSMLCGMAGLSLIWLLPASFGPLRPVVGIVALIGGVVVGAALGGQAVHLATRALKWTARSVTRSGGA
ncbi:hypothetical protein [Actinoallomurus rhizosphaericola]|uniref:hypothetical protein n=1 Tax=Actinoallomurus rhizosphaericola TaxID=2952536 RepID=UPI0020930D0D|nr:hypothetical protein [Actinoallomurus rhizosphaericola]MCO5997310.1 hypothetical protein [Actinoallomurus rhizosphaericola]